MGVGRVSTKFKKKEGGERGRTEKNEEEEKEGRRRWNRSKADSSAVNGCGTRTQQGVEAEKSGSGTRNAVIGHRVHNT